MSLQPDTFLSEGVGQATKVIWSYTTPAWGVVSVAGVPFSPSTNHGNNFENTILKLEKLHSVALKTNKKTEKVGKKTL